MFIRDFYVHSPRLGNVVANGVLDWWRRRLVWQAVLLSCTSIAQCMFACAEAAYRLCDVMHRLLRSSGRSLTTKLCVCSVCT